MSELNTERLAAWMDDSGLPGTGQPLQIRFLSGGTQNVIYELTRGDATCVIRMPPPGAPSDRDGGILRESRIIEALDGTDVPHTESIGVRDDPAVLGRPFYLMGFVDGWSPMDTPYASGGWVVWDYAHAGDSTALGGLPLRRVDEGGHLRLPDARRAVGWWLVGSARAMLTLAHRHALDRVQFGRPIASFQAVRHRLAETLVAIEGAEATLTLPGDDNPDLTSLLAKAAAGKAALTAAKHCQQVLGGIGFTEEHDLHHHVKRALVLDGLLGSSKELTRRAGAGLRARGSAPRLAVL